MAQRERINFYTTADTSDTQPFVAGRVAETGGIVDQSVCGSRGTPARPPRRTHLAGPILIIIDFILFASLALKEPPFKIPDCEEGMCSRDVIDPCYCEAQGVWK